MTGLIELKDNNGKTIQQCDFVLISQKEQDYTFYDLGHENYYLGSINSYDNPYPKIILQVERINRNQQQEITSLNIQSIQMNYWLQLNNFVPQFKSFGFNATNLNEFYEAYKGYLNDHANNGDLDAMVLLAEYYQKTPTNDSHIFDEAYQKSKFYLETASEKGHAYASYLLSQQYRMTLSSPYDKYYSENRPENYKLYLERSAEQGNRTALYILAYCYEHGKDGYAKDLKKAFELYYSSATQDYPYAMCNLADKYEHGIGTEQNYQKAIEYYQKASEYRIPEAMSSIGNMYLKGHGVPQDIEQAKIWLKKASNLNYKPAKKTLLAIT